jgi:uncharacterized lipoprotein YehR (DUF1307 family)
MKTKKILSICIIALAISTSLIGCGKKETNVSSNTTSGYSEDKKTYTIKSNDVIDTKDNITIQIPDDMTALEDSNASSDSYISLYNVGDSGIASEDDYVLTYSVINKDEISNDLETTKELYGNMYKDLQVSNISENTIDKVPYKIYSISYTSGDNVLTDYTIQFNINETYVLSKVGTTFYPLNMTEEEVVKLALNNIQK